MSYLTDRHRVALATASTAGASADVEHRAAFVSRAQVLELAVQLSRPVRGNIVEFGVWKGYSTRAIRDELWRTARWEPAQRTKRIYACDSFRGLPGRYEHLTQARSRRRCRS